MYILQEKKTTTCNCLFLFSRVELSRYIRGEYVINQNLKYFMIVFFIYIHKNQNKNVKPITGIHRQAYCGVAWEERIKWCVGWIDCF